MTQSHVSERSLMFHATDNNNVSTLQQHDWQTTVRSPYEAYIPLAVCSLTDELSVCWSVECLTAWVDGNDEGDDVGRNVTDL